MCYTILKVFWGFTMFYTVLHSFIKVFIVFFVFSKDGAEAAYLVAGGGEELGGAACSWETGKKEQHVFFFFLI